MVWNLKRTNPKDTNLEPLELIYSNDCSDTTTLKLKCWGKKFNQMNGKLYDASCFWKQIIQNENPNYYYEVILNETISYDNKAKIDSVTLEFDVNSDVDFFIRFKFKKKEIKNPYSQDYIGEKIYMSTDNKFYNGTTENDFIIDKISVNDKLINVSLISENYEKSYEAQSSPTQEYKEIDAFLNKWHQLQTEIISHKNKHIKIWFPNAVCLSQIELWKPKF